MRHQITGRKLGRTSSHRKALYRNLVADLFRHEAIVTTEAKAKEMRPMAEKMVTLAKDGSLASRRRALAFIPEKKITEKLFTTIAPRYRERAGGYTRIIKLGPRVGDGASMVKIELVE